MKISIVAAVIAAAASAAAVSTPAFAAVGIEDTAAFVADAASLPGLNNEQAPDAAAIAAADAVTGILGGRPLAVTGLDHLGG